MQQRFEMIANEPGYRHAVLIARQVMKRPPERPRYSLADGVRANLNER
jgi:hypothetical protein